jgi:hypothetical protein
MALNYPIVGDASANDPGTTWDGLTGVNVPTSFDSYEGLYIPVIWSSKLIERFYDATVLAAISNTAYEGEIANYGSKVIIRTKPTTTINPYYVDQPLVVERPVGSSVELVIDNGEYFSMVMDDVIERQSDLNMVNMWADDASTVH